MDLTLVLAVYSCDSSIDYRPNSSRAAQTCFRLTLEKRIQNEQQNENKNENENPHIT